MGSAITKTMPLETGVAITDLPVKISFEFAISWLTVSTNIALFIADTEAALSIQADGTDGGRQFVAANIYKETFDFNGQDVYFINAVLGETSSLIKFEGRK